MIKKVKVEHLKPGVFIHSFDCDWIHHPFVFNSVYIKSEASINRIKDWGIREVFIDTEKGIDIENGLSVSEAKAITEDEITQLAARDVPDAIKKIPVREEIQKARMVKHESVVYINKIMHDIKEGRPIKTEKAQIVAEKIDASISRNHDALLLLLRLKNKDNYTFYHSVSVGALIMTFARCLGLEHSTAIEIGIGGILHDIGKMRVPEQILNKPEKLSEDEFFQMKKHVNFSHDILLGATKITENSILVATQHHERFDGTGYPDGLKNGNICLGGRMASIVDVFDAITSNRCYHNGVDAVEGLRKLYSWSKYHFDEQLTHRFIKCIGIYPLGTVVALESDRIGVVVDSTEYLLKPVVVVVYDKKKDRPVTPQVIDLSKPPGQGGEDRIISYDTAQRWLIDPMKILGLR